jgi:hypothetical protein
MKKILPFLVLFSFTACHSGKPSENAVNNNPMNNIKQGMTKAEVTKAIGNPTSSEDLGNVLKGDSTHWDTTHLEKWMFGNNAQIFFTNDSVSGVDTNVMLSQRHLQHIMDSARMAEGKGSEGIIQNK